MTQPEVTIEPAPRLTLYLHDIWRYRELFYFLAWRDFAVRYKQAVIGVAWTILRPLLTMIIFTFVFNRVAHLTSAVAPYPILVYAGLLPWTFFSTSVTDASASMVGNANMVSKIYFPRIALPLSAIAVGVTDFLASLVILGLLAVVFRFTPSIHVVALPLFLLLAAMLALGFGLWLAALTVKYRDFKYIVPFALQLGLYVSPVGYASTVVSGKWSLLYTINPMVGIIDGFRWCIIGRTMGLSALSLSVSIAWIIVLLSSGMLYFYRTERTFADVI